jgi:hypothetical protein
MPVLSLSENEAASILACLRIFQRARSNGMEFELPMRDGEVGMLATSCPLSDAGINSLCERLIGLNFDPVVATVEVKTTNPIEVPNPRTCYPIYGFE